MEAGMFIRILSGSQKISISLLTQKKDPFIVFPGLVVTDSLLRPILTNLLGLQANIRTTRPSHNKNHPI